MDRNKLSGVWPSVASVPFFLVGLCCLNLLVALQKHSQLVGKILCQRVNSVFIFCSVVSMPSYSAIHFGVLLPSYENQAGKCFLPTQNDF